MSHLQTDSPSKAKRLEPSITSYFTKKQPAPAVASQSAQDTVSKEEEDGGSSKLVRDDVSSSTPPAKRKKLEEPVDFGSETKSRGEEEKGKR